MITGGTDAVVRVWNLSDMKLLRALKGHAKTVYGSAVHPAGRLAATSCAAGRVCLWDLVTGERVRAIEAGARVSDVAFSSDGTLLFGGGQSGVHVWETESGSERPRLRGYDGVVTGMALHPGGQTLAAACPDGVVRLWDVPGREIASTFRAPDFVPVVVALHPKRPLLAAGSKAGGLVVWDVGSGDVLQRVDAHEGKVLGLCFDGEGARLASGGEDKLIHVWRVRGESR